MKSDIEQSLVFCREMEKVKRIERRNLINDAKTPEDDAQHSWHIAVMAMALGDYALPGTDINHAIKLLLIHDIVEIDAGDVYAFDKDANIGKAQREEKATKRIFGILPEQKKQEFLKLWHEFEAAQSKEALFANALDRLQPVLNHFENNGVVWIENKITKEQLYIRVAPIKKGTPELWPVVTGLIEQAHENGWLK